MDSPKGRGYAAYANKETRDSNPYISSRWLTEWYEWDLGWKMAFEDRVHRVMGIPMEKVNG